MTALMQYIIRTEQEKIVIAIDKNKVIEIANIKVDIIRTPNPEISNSNSALPPQTLLADKTCIGAEA